jgi:phosphoglycerate dehydrogenase-like enzyme
MSDIIAFTSVTMRDENNEVAQTLLRQGYGLAIHPDMTPPTREQQRALLSKAAGIIAGSEPITREVMAEAPLLRVVSRNGVGYDAVDLAAATDLGIVVTFVPDAMVDAVADIALALMLAAARRIVELDNAIKQGEWLRALQHDFSGQTIGIIGTGRIGIAVARRAKAFRMQLLGCDPHVNPLLTEELHGSYVSMDELLERSDFVSLHLPASAGTKNLIGREQIARMKPGAFLVNTARGSLVDEEALLEALNEGRLAGAALDVFSKEPPAPGSAGDLVQRHPKVVATPHVASFTPITVAKMGKGAMENLVAVLSDHRPPYVANPEVYERGLRQVNGAA